MRTFFSNILTKIVSEGLHIHIQTVPIRPDAPIPDPHPLSIHGLSHTAQTLQNAARHLRNDPTLYTITPEAMQRGAHLISLQNEAPTLTDPQLVEAFALRGSLVARTPAFQTPNTLLNAAQAVIALRSSIWMLWLARHGLVKAYTHRSTHHYTEFARGPLFAFFVLAEDYMPKPLRAKTRRSLETKARRRAHPTPLETLPINTQIDLLHTLTHKPSLSHVCSTIAPVLRTTSLHNYAQLQHAALHFNTLHRAAVRMLHPLKGPKP